TVIGGGTQVLQLGFLAEGDKAVGEALRHPQPPAVAGAEHHRGPAAEGWRTPADVDRDVPDFAFGHRYQLSLWTGPLVVQPAQHALPRTRHVALDEWSDIETLQPAKPEGLVEPATVVGQHARLDDHAAGQAGLDQFHPAPRGIRTGCRRRRSRRRSPQCARAAPPCAAAGSPAAGA